MRFKFHQPTGDVSTRIKQPISVLHRYWFDSKRKEFKSLCSDGDNYFVVDRTPDDYEKLFQGMTPYEQANGGNDFTQIVKLEMFCYEPSYSNHQVCGSLVSSQVLKATIDLIMEVGVAPNYKGMQAVMNDVQTWVEEECTTLKSKYSDEEYASTIDDFMFNCRWEVVNYFSLKLLALQRYSEQPVAKTKTVFTMEEYAIMHWFLARNGGQPITKNNCDAIAADYGFPSDNSGLKLRRFYVALDTHGNQSATKNYIKRLKKILPLVQEKSQAAYVAIEKAIVEESKRL